MERATLIRLFQTLDFSWNYPRRTLRASSCLLWVEAAREIIWHLIVPWRTRGKWGKSLIRLKVIFIQLNDYRLHTGGYSVMKKDDDRYDFQIVHHFIDLNELTLKKIPVGSLNIINKYSSSILTLITLGWNCGRTTGAGLVQKTVPVNRNGATWGGQRLEHLLSVWSS